MPDDDITTTWVEKPSNVLTLRLRGGEVREIRVDHPRGHHLNPASEEDLLAKFHVQTDGVVPQRRLRHLEQLLLALGALDELGPLFTDLRELRTELADDLPAT